LKTVNFEALKDYFNLRESGTETEIEQAEESDIRPIVEDLWHPLAKEMEDVSEHNELADGDVVQKSIDYRKSKLGDDYAIFYSTSGNEKTGFVAVDIKDGNPIFARGAYGVITDLYVKKDYRRQGIAGKLLEKAEEFLEVRDISVVQLEVNVENQKALELYMDKGYEKERHKMVKELEEDS
jgi:ribosomal protein S18 acetylase RimI-like enzyme